MKTGHLFAGIGGGLWADRILGHTPLFAVEIDPYCCRELRQNFSETIIYELDVRTFDGREFRVDCIHAGFPCQDISSAGTGTGIAGERSKLFSEVIRLAEQIQPTLLFLENVPRIRTRGLETVLSELARVGYDAVWQNLSASEVGAPHLRNRWWCLAWRADADPDRLRELQQKGGRIGDAIQEFSDSASERQPQSGESGLTGGATPQGEKEKRFVVDDGFGAAKSGMGSLADGIPDWTPHPNGWWAVEPPIPRSRRKAHQGQQQLKGLGNAQVPLQAATAFLTLLKQIPTWSRRKSI